MLASGPKPGILPERQFHVQIDTTSNRPQSRSYQRSKRPYWLFNRTLLQEEHDLDLQYS
jgi:hypothetical protein